MGLATAELFIESVIPDYPQSITEKMLISLIRKQLEEEYGIDEEYYRNNIKMALNIRRKTPQDIEKLRQENYPHGILLEQNGHYSAYKEGATRWQ